MDKRLKFQRWFIFWLAASLLVGCGSPPAAVEVAVALPSDTPSPTLAPTQDLPATRSAATATEQAARDASLTQQAQAEETKVAGITQMALDRLATATQQLNLKLTATQATAAAQAQGMQAEVDRLYQAGLIQSKEGDYYRLPNFEQSWAQLDYYQWWPTGMAAENFVMSGDAYVSSASTNANWFESACGISFSLEDAENHDVVWIAMDGRAYLMSVHNGSNRMLEIDTWGPATKTDFTVHYLLVVSDKRVNLFIDDKEVLSVYDGLIRPGMIADTLVSGTNKDYGTRCRMTDTDLWIIN